MMEQLADYTIRQTMRESNHGLIFLAEPPERLGITGEVVALKALRGHSDADDFRRMANELRLLHSVDSDYVDIRLRPKKCFATGIKNNYTAFYHGAIKYGGFSGAPIFQKTGSGKSEFGFGITFRKKILRSGSTVTCLL